METSNQAHTQGNQNAILQNISNSHISVVINGEEKQIKRLLTQLPYNEAFEGRKKELADLKNLLKKHSGVSLIGIGGIGKSTVAKAFFLQNCLEFDFFLFLDGKSDLYSTFHHDTLLKNLDLKQDIEKEIPFEPNRNQLIFERVLNALANLKGTKLLLIDNAPPDTHRLKSLENADWKIMTTSRQKMDFMHAYEIEQATPEDAVAIFWVYYADKKPYSEAEKAEISKIVHRLAFHPLMIELVAKNAKDLLWTLAEINQKLAEKGLNIDQDTDIATMHNSQERVRDILGYLLQIFPLEDLPTQERHLLSLYSVLPALPLTKKTWAVLLGETEDTWQKRSLALHKKGWISQHDQAFEIHALLAEIIRLQSQTRLYQDCETMLRKLIFLFEGGIGGYLVNLDHNEATQYAPLAENLLIHLQEETFELASLNVYLSDYEVSRGNLEKGLKQVEKAAFIYKKIEHWENYCVCLDRIGLFYTTTGNLDKALIFYDFKKETVKKLVDQNPENLAYQNSLAISYQFLGNTYLELGNLEKALEFFEKFSYLKKEFYNSFPTNIGFKNGLAISFEKLGEIHSKLGNLEKALEFFEKCNQLMHELYKNYPTNVEFQNNLAVSYEKLGDTHSKLGNFEKAFKFFEKCNQLEKELHEAYPSNVNFKNGLAISYCKLAQTDKNQSRSYFEKAEKLWEELVRDAPQYVDFQRFLAMVREDLGSF